MDKIRTVQDLEAVTDVFPALWYLGSERSAIYEKRLRGAPWPWTDDPILLEYKFTNTFRAADRVSQYLIRHVIYESGGSMADDGRRRLTLIDCQNLFCEVDKYARVAYPKYNLGRTEIKHKFHHTGPRSSGPLPEPHFPPKWGVIRAPVGSGAGA